MPRIIRRLLASGPSTPPLSPKPERKLQCALEGAEAVPSSSGTLRTRGIDAISIAPLCRQRTMPQCLQARRVTAVPVGGNAPEMLHALGFLQSYELLKKGLVFRQGATTVSIFQVRRPSPWREHSTR